MRFFFSLFLFLSTLLQSEPLPLNLEALGEIPVAYEGRFCPLETCAKQWLYTRSNKINPFSHNATTCVCLLHFLGIAPFNTLPLYSGLEINLLSYKALQQRFLSEKEHAHNLAKQLILYTFDQNPLSKQFPQGKLQLNELSQKLYISYDINEITVLERPEKAPWKFLNSGEVIPRRGRKQQIEKTAQLWHFLQVDGELKGTESEATKEVWKELRQQRYSPQELANTLENLFPLRERLKNNNRLILALPSNDNSGEWLPLSALKAKVPDPVTGQLKAVENFTSYPDAVFQKIQKSYLALDQEIHSVYTENKNEERISALASQLTKDLIEGYRLLEGKPALTTWHKQLTYPTLTQLHIERIYDKIPWYVALLFLYGLSALLLLFAKSTRLGLLSLLCAFTVHTALLALRCYLLQRPPVSNMFETVLYVPWIATFFATLLYLLFKNRYLLLAASITSTALLSLIKVGALSPQLQTVQPVLDSNFWLTIHVLMVVGSYGLFALAALLSHIWLVKFLIHKKETKKMTELAKLLLQTLFIGVILLIGGTLLGGVWAAESWGRFWDWDPKESWAFISCCTYLLWIHAYKTKKIGNFGLSTGAIVGFQAISFTWYGVNYILGTGLHSYGFGSGGEIYYFLFTALESAFLALCLKKSFQAKKTF